MERRNIIPAGLESDEDDDYDDECGYYAEKRSLGPRVPPPEDYRQTLRDACVANDVPEIERALRAGALEVNGRLRGDWTALMYAAFNGSYDAMVYLLANGADPALDHDCFGVAMCVCKCCNAIADDANVLNCLRLVADYGGRDDVNARDRAGVSALMYACAAGWPSVVAYLLDRGADAEARDHENGETALFFAVRAGNADVVRLLLSRGADQMAADKRGQTVHRIAEGKNMVDVLRVLCPDDCRGPDWWHGNYVEERRTYWDQIMAEIGNGYGDDVRAFLETLSMDKYAAYFRANDVSFGRLLAGNQDPTVQAAFVLTPQRHVLATALKCFHLWNWSNRTLNIKKNDTDVENIAQTLAGVIRQLHIVNGSVAYLGTVRRDLDPDKCKQALTYVRAIRSLGRHIFDELDKKPRIGQVDYIGPHPLTVRKSGKTRLLDVAVTVSIVVLVLCRVV